MVVILLQGISDIAVPETYFVVKEVDEDAKTFQDFCDKHKIVDYGYGKFNIFLDISELQPEVLEYKNDALLMDEVSSVYYNVYTGCTFLSKCRIGIYLLCLFFKKLLPWLTTKSGKSLECANRIRD